MVRAPLIVLSWIVVWRQSSHPAWDWVETQDPDGKDGVAATVASPLDSEPAKGGRSWDTQGSCPHCGVRLLNTASSDSDMRINLLWC